MAKTKKKEKVVDLKPKAERITEEQLSNMQGLLDNINRTKFELGSLEVRKHELVHSVAGMNEGITLLQKEFQEQYGTFDINIQDGTINYGDGESN